MASLPRPHYKRGYEPGCANGELAAALAPRCDQLLVSDGVPAALDQARENRFLIPENQRPRALLRFADSDNLLVSGLLDNGGSLAKHAAVVDARLGKGHVLLFAINPMWRAATIGSYPLVTNAILNFDAL